MEPHEKVPKRDRGRPSVITDAINSFVAALRSDDTDDFDQLWADEWDAMADKSLATRTTYTSHYRKAVRAELGNHPALAAIKGLDKRENPLRTSSPRSTGGGRPNTRRERIEQFANDVAALSESRTAALGHGSTQGLADANYKRALAKRWSEEVKDMRASLAASTILNTTSHYRNELRNRGIDDDATFAVVTAPEDIMLTRTAAYREAVIEQHHDLVPVKHWQALLEIARAALPGTDATWHQLDDESAETAQGVSRSDAVRIGVALCLITGRRPYEVFCQGQFAPAPIEATGRADTSSHAKVRGYENWRILFSGQAKTRGREGTQFDEVFTIPTLAPAKTVLFAWKVLRASEAGQVWEQMTGEEFKNDLLRVPGVQCILPAIREEMFAKLWPAAEMGDSRHVADAKKLKANNIRSLYAEIADQFFRPKSKTKAAFFSEILGHTEKDIETASAYMRYWLPDQKDSGATRRVKKHLSHKIAEQLDAKGLPHEQPDHELTEEV